MDPIPKDLDLLSLNLKDQLQYVQRIKNRILGNNQEKNRILANGLVEQLLEQLTIDVFEQRPCLLQKEILICLGSIFTCTFFPYSVYLLAIKTERKMLKILSTTKSFENRYELLLSILRSCKLLLSRSINNYSELISIKESQKIVYSFFDLIQNLLNKLTQLEKENKENKRKRKNVNTKKEEKENEKGKKKKKKKRKRKRKRK
ncbi:armadillo repeat-containing protein [Anaeramoeba flamelloides]|uniref:Armadillo repeat-containing protein n=1 Tax=Anaeramoeba flamelloides TaxID=1746091 RepID=A0ABQ8YKW8_9EUKA|nr:armadillo repeat-containing protein [Anaeramoeba flamelloides]